MTVTMTQTSLQPPRFAIDGEMTIYHALELKDQLLAPLEECAHIELDLAGVSEIDCAGLQLLLMASNEAGARGKQLRIVGHSPALREVLELCNLASFFGGPDTLGSPEYPHES